MPEEVLTDNGKQFTDRFGKGGQVLFDRICRDNGIAHRLTAPSSPTTTGKIERWHQTLRRELLDDHNTFASESAVQAAVGSWVAEYNCSPAPDLTGSPPGKPSGRPAAAVCRGRVRLEHAEARACHVPHRLRRTTPRSTVAALLPRTATAPTRGVAMVRTYAKVIGIVIILIGVVGLIAGEEPLLGLVNIEVAEDVVHLLTGGVMAAVGFGVRDTGVVRTVVGVLGVVYLLVGVLGFVTPGLLGLLPAHGYSVVDNLIHLTLGVLGIVVAWVVKDPARARAA